MLEALDFLGGRGGIAAPALPLHVPPDRTIGAVLGRPLQADGSIRILANPDGGEDGGAVGTGPVYLAWMTLGIWGG